MLDEEKVRYVVGLVIFEKSEGRKIFPISRYFKKDHVDGQMFRSFFGYTFCYLLMLLLWILHKPDALLDSIGIEKLLECGKNWGIPYVGGLTFCLFVTWIVYSRRYDFASRSQTVYASRLRHLVRKYENKDRTDRTKDNRRGRVRRQVLCYGKNIWNDFATAIVMKCNR